MEAFLSAFYSNLVSVVFVLAAILTVIIGAWAVAIGGTALAARVFGLVPVMSAVLAGYAWFVRRMAVAVLVAFVLLLDLDFARAATIDIGAALGDSLRDIVSGVVTGAISIMLGWVMWIAKSKFNIEIEADHRDALKAFIERQANSVIAMGAVKLNGLKIEVNNEALAAAANTALTAVPQALAFFGLSTAKVGEMIVDLIPKQPAVAEALAVAIDTQNPATPSKPAA